MDVTRFAPEAIILHDVPQRAAGATTAPNLDLSEREEPLTGQLRPFLERKVKGSLARHGFDVQRNAQRPSNVPQLITEILQDRSKLVEHSQAMAKELHSVQTAVNSPGLLCVAVGKLAGQECVAVLKMEQNEGARLRRENTGGKRVLSMSHLTDLLISERTRIFKSSIFVLNGTTVASLQGRVADDQRGTEEGTNVAAFFLETFLGCKLKVDPRVATQNLYTATEDFINTEVPNAERKAEYTLALLAQAQAPSTTWRPRDFADQSFHQGDRTPYRDFLKARDIDPDQAIDKDVELIRNRIVKVRLETEHKILVVGPSEAIDDRVDVEDDRMVITDRVVKTRGS